MYLYLILLCQFTAFCKACFPAHQTRRYRAAVVEYSPEDFSGSPDDVIRSNLVRYGQLIEEAAKSNADVIVFPEYGLTTLAISPMSRREVRPFLQRFSVDSPSSCHDLTATPTDKLVATYISCYSRLHSIYVVVNIGEIVDCSSKETHGNRLREISEFAPNYSEDSLNSLNFTEIGGAFRCDSDSTCHINQRLDHQTNSESAVCPDDGAFHYNTNVVYDRTGRLITRYRKTHLFLEPGFQSPPAADLVTFSTDFGVEFGLFTCFDIMFHQPALELHSRRGTKDFIYPTAWIDELPFLTAVQIQEAWSRTLRVNLLAAGYHRPSHGQLGSGIYTADGPLKYTVSTDSGTRLIVTDVMEEPVVLDDFAAAGTRPVGPDSRPMLFEDLDNYAATELLDGEHTVNQCHQDLCCTLRYRSACPAGDCSVYRLLTFSGVRTVGNGVYSLGVQVCGIVGCLDRNAQPSVQPVHFEFLQMSGNFSTRYVYPTAVSTALDLLDKRNFRVDFDVPTVTWTALTSLNDVLSVGLYGRVFRLDT